MQSCFADNDVKQATKEKEMRFIWRHKVDPGMGGPDDGLVMSSGFSPDGGTLYAQAYTGSVLILSIHDRTDVIKEN